MIEAVCSSKTMVTIYKTMWYQSRRSQSGNVIMFFAKAIVSILLEYSPCTILILNYLIYGDINQTYFNILFHKFKYKYQMLRCNGWHFCFVFMSFQVQISVPRPPALTDSLYVSSGPSAKYYFINLNTNTKC
jgi:hypothetical protein